jgi:Tfp pilus assembly protein PilF
MLLGDLRRRPLLALPALALLVLTGVGVYVAGWNLWAGYHFQAAQRALERPDFARARAHLALCLEFWPRSAETHFLAAQAARRAGAFQDAEQHLSRCQKLGWPREAVELEQALARAQRGDLDSVEGYLLSGLGKDAPETVLILEALAQGYLRTYRLPEALDCLDRWLKHQPDNVQALLWRGEVKERRKDSAEAVASYRRAVELAPGDDRARLHLAEALTRSDRAEEAVEHFERLRQRQAGNPAVLLGLARCRRSMGKTEEARQLLEGVVASHPRHVEAVEELGKLLLQSGQPDEAEGWLRRAVQLAPYERDANFNLYQCLVQRGRREEAGHYLARAEKIDADFQRLSELTRKVAAEPRDPALRQEAGAILLRNGQEQEGLRWLASALQEDPKHRPTHQTLADYYERAGQRTLAAQHRRQAAP